MVAGGRWLSPNGPEIDVGHADQMKTGSLWAAGPRPGGMGADRSRNGPDRTDEGDIGRPSAG